MFFHTHPKRKEIEMRVRGYASLFERRDLSGDYIQTSAFDNCLKRQAPHHIKMLLHHDVTKPIGRWHIVQPDAHGLWVEGDIATQSSLGKDLAILIEAGALDGLSIGFRVIRSVLDRTGNRHIQEIDLLEISFVTFPMQPKARLEQSRLDLSDMMFLTQRIRRNTVSPISHS